MNRQNKKGEKIVEILWSYLLAPRIRENYNKKITLDEISKAVLCDKYALCREFKRLTGQTIIENLNNYRCIKAMGFLNEGYTVAKTAELCGFDNLSFFTKTFKKHIGKLPSEYKK